RPAGGWSWYRLAARNRERGGVQPAASRGLTGGHRLGHEVLHHARHTPLPPRQPVVRHHLRGQRMTTQRLEHRRVITQPQRMRLGVPGGHGPPRAHRDALHGSAPGTHPAVVVVFVAIRSILTRGAILVSRAGVVCVSKWYGMGACGFLVISGEGAGRTLGWGY